MPHVALLIDATRFKVKDGSGATCLQRKAVTERERHKERDTERVLSDLRATNCGDSLRLNVKWHSQCKYTHRYTHSHTDTHTQAYTQPSSYAVRRFEDSLV